MSVAKPLHSDNKSTNSFSRRWIALFDAIAGSTSDFNSSRFFIPYTHARIYLNASNRVMALVLFLHPPTLPPAFLFLEEQKEKKNSRGAYKNFWVPLLFVVFGKRTSRTR